MTAGHFLAEIVFRRLLQLLKNQRQSAAGYMLPCANRDVVAHCHDLVRHHLDLFGHFVETSHES
jgi:hypothetical protein